MVVSRATSVRGILDAGAKTLTKDHSGGLEGHGVLDLSVSDERPNVGNVVRIVPNHCCVVVDTVDRFGAVRGDVVIGEMAVSARWRSN
jgi:D-serine deaminase-like pyridoxal phosphate-dependent protein